MKRHRTFCYWIGLVVLTGCNPSSQLNTSAKVSNEAGAQKNSGAIAVAIDSPNEDDNGLEHGHRAGGHGGLIISLGRDSYHIEVVFDSERQIRLYMLGADETRVIDVETQVLKGFLSGGVDKVAKDIEFLPVPQPGDAPNRTSLFVAKLAEEWGGDVSSLGCTIPNIAIDGERFRINFQQATTQDSSHISMPSKVASEEEKALYLVPSGRYTAADIEANGNQTASQRFKGIASSHDMNPLVGDRICPITQTKANPQFEWVVDGKKYQFCCPPCVDEFVKKAKEQTQPLEDPSVYVKK